MTKNEAEALFPKMHRRTFPRRPYDLYRRHDLAWFRVLDPPPKDDEDDPWGSWDVAARYKDGTTAIDTLMPGRQKLIVIWEVSPATLPQVNEALNAPA
jgi:hypothetical protein